MAKSNQNTKRDILFWSGGKDSYLALIYYQELYGTGLVLFTTFERESKLVPHQNIPIETVYEQAIALELPLFTVPVPNPASNDEYLSAVQSGLNALPFSIGHLIFGDLHLQDIRTWREKQIGKMGYALRFPIWQKNYNELFNHLEQKPVSIRISAVASDYRPHISPGQYFNRKFANNLPESIDRMGENGEFHTEVVFPY